MHRIILRVALLSVFVTPLALAVAVLRKDVLITETLPSRLRDVGFGYLFALLSFGVGLLIAGLLSGMVVAASKRLRRPAAVAITVATPTVLLPGSVIVSFVLFTTGVPLIQNGDPYVVAAAIGGVVVGLLSLDRSPRRPEPQTI